MIRTGLAKYLLYALLLSGAGNPAVAMDLQVIHLQHRSADAIIPLIQPLVANDGGHVTGTGHKLVIEERAVEMPQLEALVKQFDTPPQRLVITVAQGSWPPAGVRGSGRGTVTPAARTYSSDIEGQADGASPGRDGGYVYGTRSLSNDHPLQEVHVLEGRWAAIQTTRQVPVMGQFLGITGGASILNTIRYRKLTTGFAVRARVHDGRVILDIAPRRARLDRRLGGALKSRSLQTTVDGKLDQWIDVGGAVSRYPARPQGWVHSTYPLSQNLPHVWVKVQEQ